MANFNDSICILLLSGCPWQSDPDCYRGDRIWENNADHPVPGGGGLHFQGQDWMYPAQKSGSHVSGQKGVRGVWLLLRSRGKWVVKLFWKCLKKSKGPELPFSGFSWGREGFIVIVDLFRIKSKVDFTVRKSVYILVKFLSTKILMY